MTYFIKDRDSGQLLQFSIDYIEVVGSHSDYRWAQPFPNFSEARRYASIIDTYGDEYDIVDCPAHIEMELERQPALFPHFIYGADENGHCAKIAGDSPNAPRLL